MEIKEVKQLLERYYEGLTSTGEEKLLHNYFSNEEVPEELEPDRLMFSAIGTEAEAITGEIDMGEKIVVAIKEQEPAAVWEGGLQETGLRLRKRYMQFAAMAAGIALLFATYLAYDRAEPKDTYDDPMMAYLELKRTMKFVSESYYRGVAPVQEEMTKLKKGVEPLDNMNTYKNIIK